MSRKYESNNDNTFGFSYNFSIPKPFDTREVVSTYNDLINPNTWKQGNVYVHYQGMKVSCADTGAIYVYIGEDESDTDVQNTEKWIAQGAGSLDVDLSGYYTKTETDSKLDKKLNNSDIAEWAKEATKPTYTINEIDPENTLVKKSDLKSVATSGDYNDLSNKPAIENLQEKLPEYKSGKVLTAKDSDDLEWAYLNEGIVEFKGIKDNVPNISILENLENLKQYEIWYVLDYFINMTPSDKGIFVIKDVLSNNYYVPNANILCDSELSKYIDINYNILKDRIFICNNVFYHYNGSKLNSIHPEILSFLGTSENNPASQQLVTDNYYKTLPPFDRIEDIDESKILEGSAEIYGPKIIYSNNKFLLESRDSNGLVYYKTWKYSLFYMNNGTPISRLYNYKNTDIYIYINSELKPLSEIINNYTGSTYIEVDNGTISVKITDLETYFNTKYYSKSETDTAIANAINEAINEVLDKEY